MYLISYDISSNKIRNKVAKTLQDYGIRVQYSVFECRIDKKRYKELYHKLLKLTEEEEDVNIRFYHLDQKSEEKTEIIGAKNALEALLEDDVILI